jgi:hypothetical protein
MASPPLRGPPGGSRKNLAIRAKKSPTPPPKNSPPFKVGAGVVITKKILLSTPNPANPKNPINPDSDKIT